VRNAPNGSGFPFVRANIFLDKGCFAPFSMITAHNTFMMIGGGINESPAVWQYTGNSFQKVSTTAIDSVLAKFSAEEISAAFSFTHSNRGAYFIGFTIADKTFVFDVITKRWHERKSYIDNFDVRWRVNSMVTAYGRVLTFDSEDGRIGELTSDVYTEYGNSIRRVISTQPFSNQGNAVKVSSIELTFESGVGNSERKDPVVSMEVSKDAKIYDFERIRSMGKVGEYNRRGIWYRVGRFPRMAIFRFKMSDPVKPVVIKCEANAS